MSMNSVKKKSAGDLTENNLEMFPNSSNGCFSVEKETCWYQYFARDTANRRKLILSVAKYDKFPCVNWCRPFPMFTNILEKRKCQSNPTTLYCNEALDRFGG